jgi:RHS repeat-associated protein
MQSVSSVPSAAKLKLDFAYDHLSRRTQKVVSTWNASAYVPQYTNRFVYDGWNLAVTLASDLSPLASFTWGLDLSGSLHGAGGVGGLLWMTIPSGTNAGTYFYAYDGNGNVMALVNAADGSVAARYEYGPFGELLRATGPMARVNPFRFSTKYQDDETGLVYYGCRFYDPNTGRWPNRDPIGELGFQTLAGNRIRRVRDGNLYCFVGNNPLTRFDLHGLTDKDVQTIINTFLSTLKTMCGDGRCCPDIGWLQNVQACVPWSEREGCTAQAVHLYVAMYPLTQGGLDDKWYANTVQETTIPCLFYHNYVTMTPLTPQPEGPDGYIVDKITVDTWKGCYTITRRKMIFIEPNPQQSLWLWKNETKCFKCKDLKAGTAK